jgi:transposase-like protein
MSDDGIDIPCPKCAEKHKVLVPDLRNKKEIEFICDSCGSKVTVNNPIPSYVDDGIDSLKRSIRDIWDKS